jgi:hypothetical protein
MSQVRENTVFRNARSKHVRLHHWPDLFIYRSNQYRVMPVYPTAAKLGHKEKMTVGYSGITHYNYYNEFAACFDSRQ